MEYHNQQELYHSLLPVFKVKQRLLKITKYKDITDKKKQVFIGMKNAFKTLA